MIEIRAAHPVAPADLDAIRALHDAVTIADGHEALGAAIWRDLETGGQPGSAGAFARHDGVLVGYAHVAPSDTVSPAHWEAGIVVDPAERDGAITASLLDAIVEHVGPQGPGEIVLWIFDPTEVDDDRTAAAGFTPARDLLQMRVPLPLAERARWPDGITVGRFRPGVDDAAWLRVNNRAFAGHPEQGGWSEATLEGRLAEPWFDPDGFLLAWSTEPVGLAGFCWTKIHPPGSDESGRVRATPGSERST